MLCAFMIIHVQVGSRGEKGRMERESLLCKTERLLLACLGNRKIEKPLLSSKSVRGVFFMEWEEKHMLAIYTRT